MSLKGPAAGGESRLRDSFLFQETAQDSKNGKDNNPDLPYTGFTRQGGEESGKHRIYIEG